MKNKKLLSLVFAGMVTIFTASVAHQFNATDFIKNFKIFDKDGKIITDKKIETDVKELNALINKIQKDIDIFAQFLTSKGVKKDRESTYLSSDISIRNFLVPKEAVILSKEDAQKTFNLYKKFDTLIDKAFTQYHALAEYITNKKLTFNDDAILDIIVNLQNQVSEWSNSAFDDFRYYNLL